MVLCSVGVRETGELSTSMDVQYLAPVAVLLQECVQNGDWKHMEEVCKHLESLCSSLAVVLASALEIILYGGTVGHSVAILSGCPLPALAHMYLNTALRCRVELRFLETIPDLCPLCIYAPCTHTTQRTTSVLFTQEQEILQSSNKNPLQEPQGWQELEWLWAAPKHCWNITAHHR